MPEKQNLPQKKKKKKGEMYEKVERTSKLKNN